MIELPTHLKVGPVMYRVFELPAIQAMEEKIDGCHEPQGKIIRVREDLNRDDMARILLHEVLHAAFYMGDLAEDQEERIVTVLANQLTGVWRDNPEFVRFMNDCLGVDFG